MPARCQWQIILGNNKRERCPADALQYVQQYDIRGEYVVRKIFCCKRHETHTYYYWHLLAPNRKIEVICCGEEETAPRRADRAPDGRYVPGNTGTASRSGSGSDDGNDSGVAA